MSETPPRPLSVAELARRLGVHRSTVGRAIDAARNDPTVPDPPQGQLDDQGREFFDPGQFQAWWPSRRPPGRPGRRDQPSPPPATQNSAGADVQVARYPL